MTQNAEITSNTESHAVNNSVGNSRPFIKVKVLNQDFPAFLDTGSSVSIIGDDVIKLVKESGVRCRKLSKEIRFLKGTCKAELAVSLKLDFLKGEKKQNFLLVPGALKSILLGRDFLAPTNISVHVGLGGWSVGHDKPDIIPFTDPPDCFLTSLKFSEGMKEENDSLDPNYVTKDQDENFESAWLNEFSRYPAQVLANWEYYPDLKDPGIEVVSEVKLSPSADPTDCLMAPTYLNEGQRQQLNIIVGEFRSIFTKKPGLCTLYEHRINTGDNLPVYTNLYPMTQAKRELFDETFFELIKYDVIERSKSPWSSNAFVVPKSDGSQRFVINYKPLNAITIPDQYPMSRMDDMLSILGQCQYFSTFDLAKGFYQISMAPEDKEKTAFISHHGLWQFKRLPMGLRNSPATFVRCIDQVLGDLKWKICCVYFDDILIFSRTFDEHLEHIQMVLSRLQEAGLTIHPGKVQLCRQKLKFLGHIIEPGKSHPNPEKVEKLRNYPVPKSVTDIMKFLGLVGFYRKFVPEFAKYAKPLHDLTKKNQKFLWTDETQVSFDQLKNSLSELTEVFMPDLNHPFVIQADASESGLGAVLLQEKDGIRYPVWFASRSLKPAETRYSTSEKECLGVLWAIEKFRGFVEYSHFIVETDHQALQWLQRVKEPSGRLARWFFTLQMYDFEVRYRPGKSPAMRGADAMSRINEVHLIHDEKVIDLSEMIRAQEEDDELGKIISLMKKNVTPQQWEKEGLNSLSDRCFIMTNGLLMRYVGPRGKTWEEESLYWRIWVPQSLILKIMTMFHSNVYSGHLGIRKTFSRLEQRVYWRNLRRDVTHFVNRCKICQITKTYRIPPAPASSFLAEMPWDVITVDLMGPYPKGSLQSIYLLVVVDMFSKLVEMFPLRQAKTENVTDKLRLVCCRWGVPRVIVSDNGTQFTSRHYIEWCKSLSIKPFFISAYHPQANLTERYNQTIKSMIIATIERCKDWDLHIPELSFALATACNDSTKFSPAYLNTGREFRTPFDNAMGFHLSSCKLVRDMGKRMEVVHSIARDNNLVSSQTSLSYYNQKAKDREIREGDKVLLKSHFLSDSSKGFSSKLAAKREGPFLVLRKLSDRTFTLKSIDTGQIVNKAHINEISPFLENGIQDVRKEASSSVSTESKESKNSDSPLFLSTDVSSRRNAVVSTDANAVSNQAKDASTAEAHPEANQ
jgi:transposase InsO family protein